MQFFNLIIEIPKNYTPPTTYYMPIYVYVGIKSNHKIPYIRYIYANQNLKMNTKKIQLNTHAGNINKYIKKNIPNRIEYTTFSSTSIYYIQKLYIILSLSSLFLLIHHLHIFTQKKKSIT